MATHYSILAWKIPWMEESGRLQSVRGVAKSQTQLSDFTFTFTPSLYQEEKDNSKSLETVNNGGSMDLNLHDNLTLVYCAFALKTSHKYPHPQHLLYSLAGDGI